VAAVIPAACGGRSKPAAAPPAATATTLAPGTVTTDDWRPPVLSGPPSPSNFCTALTAIYRHEAQLPHVVSTPLAESFLTDYISYAPTVVAEAPPEVAPSARTYVDAVSTYLARLVAAGLALGRLPAGSLAPLSAPAVNAAFQQLASYSQTYCHYTIGGESGG
jgi:hypothetical protein